MGVIANLALLGNLETSVTAVRRGLLRRVRAAASSRTSCCRSSRRDRSERSSRARGFLHDVCEPYLRLFRRFIPPLGPLDLSPMVGIFILLLGGRSFKPSSDAFCSEKGVGVMSLTPMSLTPVEVRHLELRRGLFGYRRAGVRRAMDDIADSFESVWRERAELAERLERARDRARPPRRDRGAAPVDPRVGRARRAGPQGAGAPRGRHHRHRGERRVAPHRP